MNRQYPHPAKAIAYLLGGFPLALFTFVVVVVGTAVGIGTVVVWVGVLVLVGAIVAARAFGNAHLWWTRLVSPDLPMRPVLEAGDGTALRQWRALFTARQTWRDLAFIVLNFPLSVLGFALGVVSVPLVPLALWVAPRYAWLQAQLAVAMLGQDRTAELTERAQRLQASRARGVDAAEAERRRIQREVGS
ncbi:hypothetical protein GCM10023148_04580 [Actinokineospora soli]